MAFNTANKKSVWLMIFLLFMGAMVGSALGEVIGLILPDGVVKEFFLNAVQGGLDPGTLNAVLFSITFGFTFKLNVIIYI